MPIMDADDKYETVVIDTNEIRAMRRGRDPDCFNVYFSGVDAPMTFCFNGPKECADMWNSLRAAWEKDDG